MKTISGIISMPKKVTFTACFLMLILPLLSCQTSSSSYPTITTDHNYSGTYRYMNGEDFVEDGGCLLNAVHQATMEPFDHLDFELACNRGAPSYNMGQVADRVLFESHGANTAVWSSSSGECHLVFEFSATAVVVIQIGEDCGFGGGVYATGKYNLEAFE